MANQLNFQMEQHETNYMMDIGNPQNRDGNNFIPINTSSANMPERDSDRKLFIGGLSRKTTEDDLWDYFTKYGLIDSLKIIIDSKTQISKGFAFIVFNSAEAVAKVIMEGNHFINNKKVDTKIANSRTGKIYVGGITAEITKEDIKNHFDRFGNVIEVIIPFRRTKKQRQNFCFVIFDSQEVVEKLIQTPKQNGPHYIKNVEVHVGKAIQKSNFGPSGQDIVLPQGGVDNFQNFGQSLVPNNNLLLLLLQMIGTCGYGQQVPAPMNNNSFAVTQEIGQEAGRRETAGPGRRANKAGRGNGSGNFNKKFRYQPY